MVDALGWADHLVGRSHECDYPPAVRDLPACTRPRFSTDGSSASIDRQVVEGVSGGQSLYWVDADLLSGLEPNLIITQDQCEVCAVDLREVERICRSLSSQPEIVTLGATRLKDVWNDLRTVARAIGVEDEGRRLAASLDDRIQQIHLDNRGPRQRPKVACIEWIEPLMISGNWVPELVALAGGEAVLATAGKPSSHIEWAELEAAEPDIIVLTPCGFDIERTRRETEGLRARPEWNRLRAVQTGRVGIVDGNRYLNRSGPRLVESVEILAEFLNPAQFEFGHRGKGWVSA